MKKILPLLFVLLFSVSGFSQIDLGPDAETCASEYIIETDTSGTNYIWFFEGVVIPGESLSYLVVTQSGEYSVTTTIAGTDYSDAINIMFIAPPVANAPTDLVVCDAQGSGNVTVDLTIKDVEILANLPSPNTYDVYYYLTEQDAIGQTNPLASPFTTFVNPQTIYAVAVSTVSDCMSNIVSFDIIANPSPIVYPNDTIVCDETGSGFATFDLTIYDTQFSQGNINYAVTYYETEADASAGINSIASLYTNTTPYTQILYVKVEDITTGCSSLTELYLNVLGVQSVPPTPLVVIDTDNDGFAAFNLVDKDNEITGGSTFLAVTYHETLNDAYNNVNSLTSPYNNIVANTQTVFARVEDLTQGCYAIEELILQTEYAPFAINEATLELCNEGTEGIATFDLTSAEPTILDGLNASNYQVIYYDSQSNVISNPTTFTNTSNPQEIVVEVTEIATNDVVATTLTLIVNEHPYVSFDQGLIICNGETLELNPNGNPNYNYIWNTNETTPTILVTTEGFYSVTITNPVTGCESTEFVTIGAGNSPVIETPLDLVSCDTLGVFDLTTVIPQVLNGIDPNTITLEFYETLQDAENDVNSIANANSYTTYVNPQTIYVRVNANSSTCYSIVDFNLISESCPTTITCGTPENITFCYEDNETQQYTFVSSNGSPLRVVFNSGMVENNWDELIVLDSDGVTNLNAASPYGNEGDLTNLTFESTGDTITVYVQSDFIIVGCTDENPINFDVFCSTDNFGIIEVNAFIDENNDGVFNGVDTPFTNGFFTYEKNNDTNITTVNAASGGFNIYSYDDTNTYDITLSTNEGYESCYTITTSLFENVNVTSGNTIAINFPVTEQSQCEDLSVSLFPSAPPRPGFDYYNYLIIENTGYSTINSGTVTFINDPLVNYLGVSYVSPEVTVTSNANGFTFNFVNLLPGETRGAWIEMNVPASVNLGEYVTNTATYTTAANDIVVDNNTSVLSQEVVGSYDPNDITESHGPEIVYEDFITTNEYLYYTVRFQNVGTAEAINVRIENTINPLLDVSTLEVLHTSHDAVLKAVDNQLTWFFDAINLPAESQDADGSNGYVYYKIKPTAGYNIGTIIPNTAEIYFDFNAAVITNTFNTEFVEPALSVEEFSLDNTFTVHPNPANTIVNITLGAMLNEDAKIIVYDIQGKRLINKTLSKNTLKTQLNIENLQSGMYFINLKTNTKETIKRLVVE